MADKQKITEEIMDIIIIGCGKVGTTLAEQLVREDYNVVMIDTSAERMQRGSDDIDAIKLVGNGASISMQIEAGVQTADMLIAVTGSDEMNLLCCLIARKVGHCHTIARVRNPIYSNELTFIKQQLGISMIINPEYAAATEISRILRFPSAIKIDPFAKGKVELLKFKVKPEFKLDGLSVMDIDSQFRCDVLIGGVERGDEVAIPDGKFVIKNGDMVSIIASPANSAEFFRKIGIQTNQVRNTMIVGGGTIAYYLAKLLAAMKIRVKIVEKDKARCEVLTELLDDALILNGDGTDRQLLLEEGLMDGQGLLKEPYFTKGVRIGDVLVTKESVRAVQLAKGAIAAGIEILADSYGIRFSDISKVVLAGGFGYYLDPKAAVAIGLLPEELADCTVTGGNTALSGAAMVGSRILTAGGKQTAEGTLPDGGDDLRKRQELQIRILNLAEEEKFPETFLTKINFN